MCVGHVTRCDGKLHLFKYPLGSDKTSIGVLEPGQYHFSYEEGQETRLVIADDNGEIKVVDCSWGCDPWEDPVIHGQEVVFILRPGQWVQIQCDTYVAVRYD